MKIRNRTSDVAELRCHVCQSFLKMIICAEWKQILCTFVQEKIDSHYKDNYIEQYKCMRKKGIENYSIDDMDVPFIVNVLQYCPQIATITITKNTKKALYNVKGDRHITNHSSENEPEEELYLRALISLRDLQDFLHTIDFYETAIPNEQRLLFIRKYSKEIDDLKLEIYNDCIEMFQIKKDIQLIISSENQEDTFLRIFQSYNNRQCLSNRNREQMSRFLIEASNAGVKDAHVYAANEFWYLHDFNETEKRFEMMLDGCEKISSSDVQIIIDYINDMYITGKKPTKRMIKLINLIKDQGFDIEETDQGIIWK